MLCRLHGQPAMHQPVPEPSSQQNKEELAELTLPIPDCKEGWRMKEFVMMLTHAGWRWEDEHS